MKMHQEMKEFHIRLWKYFNACVPYRFPIKKMGAPFSQTTSSLKNLEIFIYNYLAQLHLTCRRFCAERFNMKKKTDPTYTYITHTIEEVKSLFYDCPFCWQIS